MQNPTTQPSDREYLETLYKVFDKFALDDQRTFYEHTLTKFRQAASQVNRLRAVCSLLTGIVSAAASLLVQANFVGNNAQCSLTANAGGGGCAGLQLLVFVLLGLAIIIPAVGGALNTLADLFQWDKLVTVYDASLASLEVAAAAAPIPEMDDQTYQASLQKFVVGTLGVMHDESAQWGQLIRTPEQVQQFLQGAQTKAVRASGVPGILPTDTSTQVTTEPTVGTTTGAGTPDTAGSADSHTAG